MLWMVIIIAIIIIIIIALYYYLLYYNSSSPSHQKDFTVRLSVRKIFIEDQDLMTTGKLFRLLSTIIR